MVNPKLNSRNSRWPASSYIYCYTNLTTSYNTFETEESSIINVSRRVFDIKCYWCSFGEHQTQQTIYETYLRRQPALERKECVLYVCIQPKKSNIKGGKRKRKVAWLLMKQHRGVMALLNRWTDHLLWLAALWQSIASVCPTLHTLTGFLSSFLF